MKIIHQIGFWGLLSASCIARELPYFAMTVNDEGFGPVKIGMTLSEASTALGLDIEEAPWSYGGGECASYAFGPGKYKWDIRFLTEYGKIGRIDIFTEMLPIRQGVGVGSPVEKILQVYDGKYDIEPAHDAYEKHIQIPVGEELHLTFTGTFIDDEHGFTEEQAQRIEEVIRQYSIGRNDVGTVEGCL